jgi:CheY-like chemotaxis protein
MDSPEAVAPRKRRKRKREKLAQYYKYKPDMPHSPSSEMPLKVMVVDDDPDIRRMLRVFFWTRGLEVAEAENGMQALMLVKREKPDIVLLDIMMPDIDGFEVCRRLKLDPETGSIPIVFISARTGKEHIEQGLSLGADGYVTKPFDPATLLDKIVEVAGALQVPQAANEAD